MAGSSISVAAIGRQMENARLKEQVSRAGRICCRGHEPERILSLPIVDRPEGEREGNLSEVGVRVKKERHSKDTSWATSCMAFAPALSSQARRGTMR